MKGNRSGPSLKGTEKTHIFWQIVQNKFPSRISNSGNSPLNDLFLAHWLYLGILLLYYGIWNDRKKLLFKYTNTRLHIVLRNAESLTEIKCRVKSTSYGPILQSLLLLKSCELRRVPQPVILTYRLSADTLQLLSYIYALQLLVRIYKMPAHTHLPPSAICNYWRVPYTDTLIGHFAYSKDTLTNIRLLA